MTLTPQRLKRLVKHRERLERLQERELAEALRLHRRREEALTESLGNREALLDIQRPATGPLDAADLQAELAYLRRVDREILARRAALQHSANDVEAERAELLDRRRPKGPGGPPRPPPRRGAPCAQPRRARTHRRTGGHALAPPRDRRLREVSHESDR